MQSATELSVIMLSVVMSSVILISVLMLTVVAPTLLFSLCVSLEQSPSKILSKQHSLLIKW
jgi:hypothetical protein